MTIIDLEPANTVDWFWANVDPYKEAYENIFWIWDLADLVTPEELQQLGVVSLESGRPHRPPR